MGRSPKAEALVASLGAHQGPVRYLLGVTTDRGAAAAGELQRRVAEHLHCDPDDVLIVPNSPGLFAAVHIPATDDPRAGIRRT